MLTTTDEIIIEFNVQRICIKFLFKNFLVGVFQILISFVSFWKFEKPSLNVCILCCHSVDHSGNYSWHCNDFNLNVNLEDSTENCQVVLLTFPNKRIYTHSKIAACYYSKWNAMQKFHISEFIEIGLKRIYSLCSLYVSMSLFCWNIQNSTRNINNFLLFICVASRKHACHLNAHEYCA